MALPVTFSIDRAGFPVVETSALPFRVLWLPVTKIQFEHFLVDTGIYDNNWYQDKLQKFTPRISASGISVTNYWEAFMTGILPDEALRYAEWAGPGYDLPTAQEWKSALTYFARWSADSAFINGVLQTPRLSERARQVIQKIEPALQAERYQLSNGPFLCDQMAMRLGVLELLYEDQQRMSFCCWGKTNMRLSGNTNDPVRDTEPIRFNRRSGARARHVGFRLIVRQY